MTSSALQPVKQSPPHMHTSGSCAGYFSAPGALICPLVGGVPEGVELPPVTLVFSCIAGYAEMKVRLTPWSLCHCRVTKGFACAHVPVIDLSHFKLRKCICDGLSLVDGLLHCAPTSCCKLW